MDFAELIDKQRCCRQKNQFNLLSVLFSVLFFLEGDGGDSRVLREKKKKKTVKSRSKNHCIALI